MRILAYGGAKGYTERLNLGGWRFDPGILGNDVGVPKSGLAVGCGLVGTAPYLIVRQLQDDPKKRSTVFTLFFDPGEDLWRRFGWNAGAIALALFGPRLDGPAMSLLSEPENTEADDLRTLLTQTAGELDPDMDEQFLDLWWGAAAAKGDVVADGERAGLGLMPDLSLLARRVAALPPAWRIGRGWIVGGGRSQHPALSVALSVAFGGDLDPSNEVFTVGRHWRKIWGVVADLPSVQAVASEPPYLWKDVNPENRIQAIRWLGELRLGESDAEEVLPNFLKMVKTDALRGDLLRELRLFLTTGEKPLSAKATEFLVFEVFNRQLVLASPNAERLDVETLVRLYVESRRRPGLEIALQDFTRQKIWTALILHERDHRAMQRLAYTAINDLPVPCANEVLDEALKCSTKDGALSEWQSFFDEHPQLFERAKKMINELLNRQMTQRAKNWKRDYLAYCWNDHGGQLSVIQPPYSASELANLVGFGCGELGNRSLGASAEKWLVSLEDSKLRDRLPWSAKIEVANAVPQGWRDFSRMLRLLDGQARDGDDAPLAKDSAERVRLRRELEQAVSRDASALNTLWREPGAPADIKGLNRMLGKLPSHVVQALDKRPIALDQGIPDGYFEGLREAGCSNEVLTKAKSILSNRSSGIAALRCSLEQFTPDSFVEWVPTTLLSPETGSQASSLAANLSKLDSEVPAMRELIKESLEKCDWQLDWLQFSRRFPPCTPEFEMLVPCLPWPAQARVFHELESNQPLRKQAERACIDFLRKTPAPGTLPVFVRTLLHFLHSEVGRNFRGNLIDGVGQSLELSAKEANSWLTEKLSSAFGEPEKPPKRHLIFSGLGRHFRFGGK